MKYFFAAALVAVCLTVAGEGTAGDKQCQPTRPDMLGPFYEPDQPERTKVGEGYVLSGQVLSSADCTPLEGASIEFWLVGPKGSYDADHRATVYSDKTGAYRFESNFPPGYVGRPPHIHIRVSVGGYRPLITQHYPKEGDTEAKFDLVLIPR